MKKMHEQVDRKKTIISCMVIILAVICSMIGMVFGDKRKMNDTGEAEQEKRSEKYETRKLATDAPYPERKKTEYRSNQIYDEEEYQFSISNMVLIDEESEFPQKQMKPMMNALQEYLNKNKFDSKIDKFSIAEETVYYYQNKFGMDICLNNTMLDYVKISGDDEHIVCQDDNYGEPPILTDEDEEEIDKIHKNMYTSYLPDIEYDLEDFPYTRKDMEKLIHGYYADMSGNYYENYKKYGTDVQKYMEKELDYFNYEYSTYKYNTTLLKKELAAGNEEMCKYGDIKASIKGYMQLYATNIIAKVELTMCYKKQKRQKMVWVTLISDGNKLLILPEDRSVEEYWEYKYQY